MGKTILSQNQQDVLSALGDESLIRDSFYLTGGTALAEYYLHHRLSEDLDFFTEQEVDSPSIFSVLKKIQKQVRILSIDYQQSFNRNLFFLQMKDDVIKTEFTYFPFPRIEPSVAKKSISIDSLLDIAVNKLFTIYQKPRSRDFIDLYCILKKQPSWTIASLTKKAKVKFDWHVDPVQLGGQFLQATEVKDYPRMIVKISPATWQKFFLSEAKKLEKDILSS